MLIQFSGNPLIDLVHHIALLQIMFPRLLRVASRRFTRPAHTHQPQTDPNWSHRQAEFEKHYCKNTAIPGHCTPSATLQYSKTNPHVSPSNFRLTIDSSNLTLSSVGVGTYNMDLDITTDLAMYNAIIDSVMSGGVNMVDTCASFRHNKSERVVNAALNYLIQEKGYNREQLVVGTKAGYIADDADNNTRGMDLVKEILKEGMMDNEDVMNQSHCVHPVYLELSLERSLINLGLETIDVFYLNNVIENHLPFLGVEKFENRLAKAFELCEKMVQSKKIQYYGISSWACLRLPATDKDHYDFQRVTDIARKVADFFKYQQIVDVIKINVMMPESFGDIQQNWIHPLNKKPEQVSLLAACYREGVNVISCSPLMNGVLLNVPLPSEPLKCSGMGAKHVQFIRSIPAPSLLCTLIGHRRNNHVKSNLEVITTPRMTNEQWIDFIKPAMRKYAAEKSN